MKFEDFEMRKYLFLYTCILVFAVVGCSGDDNKPCFKDDLAKMNTPEKKTKREMAYLYNGLANYKTDMGVYPNVFEDLMCRPNSDRKDLWDGPYLEDRGIIVDLWNTEYVYKIDDNGIYVNIHSCGPDRINHTKDDILFE